MYYYVQEQHFIQQVQLLHQCYLLQLAILLVLFHHHHKVQVTMMHIAVCTSCASVSFIDDVLLLGVIGPIILLVFAVIILIALILVVGILILCCRKNRKVAASTCCASKNVSVLHVYVSPSLIFTTVSLCITDEKVNFYNCYSSYSFVLCTRT